MSLPCGHFSERFIYTLNAPGGTDSELYTRSVDIALSRLRQKLKPLNLIKTVRGAGYVWVGKPS